MHELYIDHQRISRGEIWTEIRCLPFLLLRIYLCCVKRKDKNAKAAQRVRAKEEGVGETALASLYLSARDQSPRTTACGLTDKGS